MKITNRFGLPKTLVNVAERDDYSKGDARISITGLLTPPRIAALRRKYHNQIETDISDGIWAILGRAIHKVLEQGADEEHVPEERLFADFDGWVVSGALDLQHLGDGSVAITDYKFTSSFSVLSEKPEWVEQTNSYACLVRRAKGVRVTKLSICAIVRDWSRHRAKADINYPQAPIVMVPIEVWPEQEAEDFIKRRVHLHREAIARHDMGDPLPECTNEDRWMRETTWAVRKVANKRATKVFTDEAEAKKFALSDEKFIVEKRPGEPIRCTGNYCHVAPWCAQFAAWQGENK
jgi:hypothetical protein